MRPNGKIKVFCDLLGGSRFCFGVLGRGIDGGGAPIECPDGATSVEKSVLGGEGVVL